MSRSIACGLPYGGRSNASGGAPEQVHRDRAGAGGGDGEEQPVPERPAALRRGDDAGEEQRRRHGRAEQGPDRRGAGDQHGDLRGNLREQPREQGHDDAHVDRDDRVLGAEAHAAGEAEHRHHGEAREHAQPQRRRDQLGRRRVGPAVAGEVPQPDADRETREGEDQHDPPAVRVDAERVGQGVPEHAAQQVGQLLEGPQEQRREGAEHDRRDREQQQLSWRCATVGRRSSQAHRGLLPVGCCATTANHRPTTRHHPGSSVAPETSGRLVTPRDRFASAALAGGRSSRSEGCK